MYAPPPPDPRGRPVHKHPTWRSVLVSYALVAAIPLLLWVVSRPLAGTAAIAAVVGLSIGARRAYRLIRCVRDCQGLAFDLVGRVRITITRPPADGSN